MERIDQSSYVEALRGERLEVYFGVSAQCRGTLRVALEAIYEPDWFLDEAGNIIGFNPDVAEEIASRLGLERVEYTEPSFSVIVAGNWQDRWDVAIHGITITEERLEVLLYTQPYRYSDSKLAVHADNTTISDSSTDLDGASIGVCGGCVQERYLDKDLKLPAVESDSSSTMPTSGPMTITSPGRPRW